MPQDGIQRSYESFNSFLAGVLLTRKSINNFDFFNLMSLFEEKYNVDIVSDNNDLCISIYLDDTMIKLRDELSDFIIIDNKKITVYDYLYNFTTFNVRKFFNIPDLEKVDNVKSSFNKTRSFIRILSRNRKKVII